MLPQHEFGMIIVAPKGSGKTNFICNLLLNHYRTYFHRVLVCSPTVYNDEKWRVVQDAKHVLRENKKLKKLNAGGGKTERKLPQVVMESGMSVKPAEKFDGKVPKEDFFSDLDDLAGRIEEQNETILKLDEMGYTKYVADRMFVILDDQAGLFRGGQNRNPVVNYAIKHRHVSSSFIVVTQSYKIVPVGIRN